MHWRLRDGVHAALCGHDLVVLDLKDDAYLCLRAASARPKSHSPGRRAALELSVLDPEALDALRVGGFLALGPAAIRPGPPPIAGSDLRDAPGGRPTAADLWAALGALADLRRLGSDPSISSLLPLAGPPRPVVDGQAATVQAAARRFADLLPWLPWSGACLTRSALLAAFLRRLDLRADWVIAVRTWPFRAHCWLQHGDVCLNDDAERLRAYTPLLAA